MRATAGFDSEPGQHTLRGRSSSWASRHSPSLSLSTGLSMSSTAGFDPESAEHTEEEFKHWGHQEKPASFSV